MSISPRCNVAKKKKCTCASVQIHGQAVVSDSSVAVKSILDHNTVDGRLGGVSLNKHGEDRAIGAIVQVALNLFPIWSHVCVLALKDSDLSDGVIMFVFVVVVEKLRSCLDHRMVMRAKISDVDLFVWLARVVLAFGKVKVHIVASRELVQVLGDLSEAWDGAVVLWTGSDFDVCDTVVSTVLCGCWFFFFLLGEVRVHRRMGNSVIFRGKGATGWRKMGGNQGGYEVISQWV